MKNIKIILGLSTLLLLQACGKSEETGATGRVTTTAAAPSPAASCATDAAMKVGRVYDDTNGAVTPSFNDQLKNFISGFDNPSAIEYVSGLYNDNTRVELTGALKFDTKGNILAQQSQIRMSVYDSRSVYSGSPPFSMVFSTAQGMAITGTYNASNKYIDVQFSDALGTLTIAAVYDGTFVSGSLYFNNKKSHDGSAGKSGRLGGFYINGCSIL